MKTEAKIPVTVQDVFGEIVELISLRDLIRTGDNYSIHLINGGKVGSSDFELSVQNEDGLLDKVRMAKDLVTA